jgi:hypothetical protein
MLQAYIITCSVLCIVDSGNDHDHQYWVAIDTHADLCTSRHGYANARIQNELHGNAL